MNNYLGWFGIIRLGLVQVALGSIIVLTTSTLNRVMVVEMALPAILPGTLIGLYHAIQLSRPKFGHLGDSAGRRTPWIILGMIALALGGAGGAFGTALMEASAGLGLVVLLASFVLVGLGVGAAGTSLLVMLAKCVAPERRPAAASLVWIMMIAGFAITAGIAGHLLDPFSLERMVIVSASVSVIAVLVTCVSLWGLEGDTVSLTKAGATARSGTFSTAMRSVWQEPHARLFTIFVFMSMLAYSAQDLILEPYAGALFGLTPGESTKLAGVQNVGVLCGMLLLAAAGSLSSRGDLILLRRWIMSGCVLSALALLGLVIGSRHTDMWPLTLNVFALGLFNGLYAVAAIATMMALAGQGQESREGLRMGLWGASQAVAMGIGGFVGTVGVDLMRVLDFGYATAYSAVFLTEAILFFAAAALARRVIVSADGTKYARAVPRFGKIAMREVLDG